MTRIPSDITVHSRSRQLELVYEDGTRFLLPCEYLRVYSPSAEVRGHGPGQEVLQVGKEAVTLVAVEPVGNYALRLNFSDGHDSGLYTWRYLQELGEDQERLWRLYLERLEAAGHSRREPPEAAS
jgi:DUF971 family protein